jgi:hypothetical protein
MRVAFASISTFRQHKLLARLGKVRNWLRLNLVALGLPGSVDDRADRDFDVGILCAAAVLVFSLAVGTTLGADQRFKKRATRLSTS